MPVGERIEHGGVDSRLVDRRVQPPALAGPVPVEHDEAVLLTHEVQDREVREHPPEREAAEAVEHDAGAEADQRGGHVVGAPAPELVRIEVGTVERRPHVGHVDAGHEDQPAPRRQPLRPERGHEQHQEDRHDRRAQDQRAVEDGRVNPAAHQSSRYANRVVPVKNREGVAARLTASAPARSVANRSLTETSDARWEVRVSQTRGGRNGGGRGPRPAVTLRARLSALYPGTSGRRLKQWLEGGRVQVNGEVVRRGDASVAATDRVELAAPPPAPFPPLLTLVHEDDDVLVIDKPAGLLTISTRASGSGLPTACCATGWRREAGANLRRPPARPRDLRPGRVRADHGGQGSAPDAVQGGSARTGVRGSRGGRVRETTGTLTSRLRRTAGSAYVPRAAARRPRGDHAVSRVRRGTEDDAPGAHADHRPPRPDPLSARDARPPDRGRPRLRQPARSAASRVSARHAAGLRAPEAAVGRVRQPAPVGFRRA